MFYILNSLLLVKAITNCCFAQISTNINLTDREVISSKIFVSFYLKAKETVNITYTNQFLEDQNLQFNNTGSKDTLIIKSIHTNSPLSFSYQIFPPSTNEYYFIHYMFIASPGDTLRLSLDGRIKLNVSRCNKQNVIADGNNSYYFDGGFLPVNNQAITWEGAWPFFMPYFNHKYDEELERIDKLFVNSDADSLIRKRFIINCKIHYYKRIFDWVWQKEGTYYKPAINLLVSKLSDIENLLNDEHIFLTPELLNIIDGAVRLKIIQKGKDFTSGSNIYNEAAAANIGKFKKAYLSVCVIKNPVKKGLAFDHTLRDYKLRYKNDRVYLTYVDSVLKERNKIVLIPGKNKLAYLNGASVTLANIIKNKKYTFIDLWASWCVPCRQQLPYLDSIKNLMKAYPINFISINLDEKPANWKTASKAEAKYLKNNNYYLLNERKTDFIKALNIESIPRYIVLQGTKIVASDFYQPTELAFKKELIELIKSK